MFVFKHYTVDIYFTANLVTILLFEHIQIIIYESPTYGAHHYSLDIQNSLKHVRAPLRKPKWVDELHQIQPIFDMVQELSRLVIVLENSTFSINLLTQFSDCRTQSFWQLTVPLLLGFLLRGVMFVRDLFIGITPLVEFLPLLLILSPFIANS